MLNHKSKKADLSLSVNAIVVLILAIVMLGLALGFVKTMFGKSANQFDEIISTEKDPEQADMNEPIKLSKGTISLKAKEVGVLKVSVFNPGFVDYGELTDSSKKYDTATATLNLVTKPEFVIDNMKGCFEGATLLTFKSQSKQLISSRTSKVVGISFVPASTANTDFVCAICTRRIGGNWYGEDIDNDNIIESTEPSNKDYDDYTDNDKDMKKFRQSGEQYCTSLRVIVKP